MHAPQPRSLRVLHVVRAPVGGLFRHICDLGPGQAERGHAVGLIADSGTGGAPAEAALAALAPQFSLGITRFPIARNPGPSDIVGLIRLSQAIRSLRPDVIHGHGAKGGAFARLVPAAKTTVRAYTPHGGSLHYRPGTLKGRTFGTMERLLMPRTDLLLFESDFARRAYLDRIGTPSGLVRVVCNGIGAADLVPVQPVENATDLVFVGELRRLKGVDVLLAALDWLRRQGRDVSLTIVGEGPDGEAFQNDAKRLGLAATVRFVGYRQARDGFSLGRILVVPSRNESFPYVVLEAAAAGLAVIATAAGGIPEIFGPAAGRLAPPDDASALGAAIAHALDDAADTRAAAQSLQERVKQHFSVERMVEGVLDGYRDALTERVLTAQ